MSDDDLYSIDNDEEATVIVVASANLDETPQPPTQPMRVGEKSPLAPLPAPWSEKKTCRKRNNSLQL